MDLDSIGRLLLLVGAGFVLTGILFIVGARLGLGSLPGDLQFKTENISCYVPIATSILISLVLTLLLNLFFRWYR